MTMEVGPDFMRSLVGAGRSTGGRALAFIGWDYPAECRIMVGAYAV